MTKKLHFEYIDSLRGIAILMVILVHSAQKIPNTSNFFTWFSKFGQMGVVLFFCISALTLCMSLERAKSINFLNFYLGRFFRLAPMYYFGIIFYLSLKYISIYINPSRVSNQLSFETLHVLCNLFFIHGLIPAANNNVVPGGWSIGTEVLFYIFIPFIFRLYKKSHSLKFFLSLPIITFLVISVFFYTANIYLNFDTTNNSFWYYNILNHLPVFLVGISFYFIETNFHFSIKYPIILFFSLIAICIYIFNFFFSITIVPFICSIAFVILIYIFKKYQKINFGFLQAIGRVSYSMYILHFLFAFRLTEIIYLKFKYSLHPDFILIFSYLVVILITFFCSLITKSIIEDRFINLGKSIVKK